MTNQPTDTELEARARQLSEQATTDQQQEYPELAARMKGKTTALPPEDFGGSDWDLNTGRGTSPMAR